MLGDLHSEPLTALRGAVIVTSHLHCGRAWERLAESRKAPSQPAWGSSCHSVFRGGTTRLWNQGQRGVTPTYQCQPSIRLALLPLLHGGPEKETPRLELAHYPHGAPGTSCRTKTESSFFFALLVARGLTLRSSNEVRPFRFLFWL